ncbi:alpha/beta fold hydrolase [Goodfellowiella coeruleoviolacea]|uniref:Alpha/beta hydrolase n=1 Tax=Goodfellowiella coeruleoviolacea TaxID=334858 RepID=A0AAE3G9R3_9PSEU|nr:alpha/beta hydrolase [Goodfellowiella coeruleoviolacea]MCP2163863.1 hypothetical protein [Goodfellowiella coeruleoviolacea]
MTTHHDRGRRGDTTVLLIHGGLWEPGMDANRFWTVPGITAGIERAGFSVLAPNRLHQPPNWDAEVEHLAGMLPARPVVVVAGSNGCSVAIRLALTRPRQVARLLLGWPATAGDARVDSHTRASLSTLGASPGTVHALLAGQTVRGVTDTELATLSTPVAVLPAVPANAFHQRHTVDALRRLLPHSVELPGCPEPPRRDFQLHLDRFLAAVTAFADA